ncbi:MAG: Gfo/Idh/MocA family oxidoreductase [Armatimonadetes bacterium]|nr:Gfo/Idh/MocA family oxidoreductase [Armatimonadota bacterium]
MIRVGLVGCGIISGAHLDTWAQVGEHARVVAVADVDADKAQAAATKSGASVLAFEAMLADPAIDAVDLCLPHHLHRPFTEAALAAGKHVMCQKPIAHTLEDADAMIAAAERSGRTLLIAESCRYDPLVPRARELVDTGCIGDVLAVQVTMAWWQGNEYLTTDWRFDEHLMGGGALVDGGIHYVDYLLHYAGLPEQMSCLTRRVRDCYAGEDVAAVTARHRDGVLSVLTISASSRHTPGMPLRVLGTAGSLTAHRGRLELRSDRDGEQTIELPPGAWMAGPIEDFVSCVATGAQPLSSAPAARDNLAYVKAAYESAREGRVVSLA